MATTVIRLQRQSALPARRNPVDTAQDDEQQRLQAAIAAHIDRAELIEVVNLEIIPHEGIIHLGCHELITLPGLFHIGDSTPNHIGCQCLQIRSEAHESAVLCQIIRTGSRHIQIERRFRRRLMQRVSILDAADKAVLHAECLPFRQLSTPISRTGRCIFWSNAIWLAFNHTDVTLLGRLRRERHVYQVITRHEVFLFHIHGGIHGDAVRKAPLLLDFPDHRIEPIVVWLHFPARQTHQFRMLGNGTMAAQEVTLLTMNINEVNAALQLPLVKLFFGHCGNELLQLGQGLFTVPGILRRQTADAFLFALQTGPEHIRQVFLQTDIDRLDSSFQITCPLALEDILRQRH